GTVFKRSQAVPVEEGTVLKIGCGDPSWPSMNPESELTEYSVKVTYEKDGIAVWDGESTAEPTLIDGVYQISDGEELAWFRDKVNSEIVFGSTASNSKSSYLSAVLKSDIDLGGHEWAPIGTYGQVNYSVACGYAGTFDGNGYAINGLSVTTGAGGSGLFGTAFTGAVIKDLTVAGEIKSGQYYGGIAAYASAASITNCTSYVDITVEKAGSSRSFAGGIAGYMGDPNYIYTRTLIESCVNYGTINGVGDASSWVGGIVGSASYGIGVKNCGNEGVVTGCGRVGGIAGDGALPVSSCYNTGSVTSPAAGSSTGGIAGFSNKQSESCYNIGSVSGVGKVGGIVGELHSGYGGMIAGSYNAGSVSSQGTGATDTSGAIAGYKGDDGTTGQDPKGAVVTNSYYLVGSAASGIGYNAHAEDIALAKTETELKSPGMVATLGSAFAAGGGQNSGYPVLTWQKQAAPPKSVTVTVAVVDNEGGRFILLPTEITVIEGKAAEYGYFNAAPMHLVGGVDHGVYPGQVSALDALIAAHEHKYGTGFSPGAYLSGTSTSANLTKMFGIGPYITYAANNQAMVGSMSDGYAMNECVLSDGDVVFFIRATEDSWGMDYYSYFSKNHMAVTAGELFELELFGFDPMDQMAGLPGTQTPPQSVVPIPDASIMLVNPDGTLGLLDETKGYSTGAQGKAMLSISEPGTYFISAIGMIENDWGMDVSVGLPFCEIVVAESDAITIKVTKGATAGLYSKTGLAHYVPFTSYSLAKDEDLSDGQYDVYTAAGLPHGNASFHIEACIHGETAKQAKFINQTSYGKTVTVDLTPLAEWEPAGNTSMNANFYTNLDNTGTVNLAIGDVFYLDIFRVWQAMDGVVSNYFIEPDYSFEVSGDSAAVERVGAPGREQLKITALKQGACVVKVTYSPVEYVTASGTALKFNAIDPRNTGAVVVNVGSSGTADFGISARNDFDTYYFDKAAGFGEFSLRRKQAPLSASTTR
ncbi:MAG: hypothetical protein FWG42_12360, partial [Clostridiales bacterium]|nr:hypothetical protein [Clostridiales bacterium]